MRTISIYEALVLQDCHYGSGIRFLREGDKVELQVSPTGKTVFVMLGEEFKDMVYSTDDEDWVWSNLVVEAPWKQFHKV